MASAIGFISEKLNIVHSYERKRYSMGMRIFWFLLALFVPKFINDALFPIFNSANTGLSLPRALLPAIPAAIAGTFFLYKAFHGLFSFGRIKCPDCREKILKDARVCKHCGYRFSSHSLEKNISNKGVKDISISFEKWVRENNVFFYLYAGLFIFTIIWALVIRYNKSGL